MSDYVIFFFFPKFLLMVIGFSLFCVAEHPYHCSEFKGRVAENRWPSLALMQ